jgi:hypothetical protein
MSSSTPLSQPDFLRGQIVGKRNPDGSVGLITAKHIQNADGDIGAAAPGAI